MFGIAMELGGSITSRDGPFGSDCLSSVPPHWGGDRLEEANVVSPVKGAGVQFKWTTVVIREIEG